MDMKYPGLVLFTLLLPASGHQCGAIADKNPATTPAESFSAIDPMDNLSLDEVFFISGTTNLSVFSRQKNLKSDWGLRVFWIEFVIYIISPSLVLGVYAILGHTKTRGSA